MLSKLLLSNRHFSHSQILRCLRYLRCQRGKRRKRRKGEIRERQSNSSPGFKENTWQKMTEHRPRNKNLERRSAELPSSSIPPCLYASMHLCLGDPRVFACCEFPFGELMNNAITTATAIAGEQISYFISPRASREAQSRVWNKR